MKMNWTRRTRILKGSMGCVVVLLLGCSSLGDLTSQFAQFDSSHKSSPQIQCASLTGVVFNSGPPSARATVLSAVEVAAGALPPSTPAPTFPPMIAAVHLPAYCKVKAVVSPSIGVEIWLPLSSWNGRLQAVGTHRFAGAVDYGDMFYQLSRGYAVASSDAGHAGQSALPWMQNTQQIVDYGYRGVHEMTVLSKAIITAFYGREKFYSYFNGCSTGGKEALMEAQRYPHDFHGISAGDPNHDQIGNRAQYIWNAQVTFQNPSTKIQPEHLKLIHQKVLEQCDALDGVKDGSIEDPRQCHFEPSGLLCTPGQSSDSCLSSDQVGALQKLYEGPRNPRTGERVYSGWSPGSELGWGGVIAGPNVFPTADLFFKNMVFKDPNWSYKNFNFDSHYQFAVSQLGAIVNADDPDLSRFEKNGGKLLHYHGWKDTNHAPMQSVDYYESVLKNLQKKGSRDQAIQRAHNFYRLFMSASSTGCDSTGNLPTEFDPMDALTAWVEKNQAPERIIVVHKTNGEIDRSRPLCPYPQVANYKGSGNTNDASHFACQIPSK